MVKKIGKRIAIVLAIAILIIVVILSSFVYLNTQKPYAGDIEQVRVGFFGDPFLYIAQEQGFFSHYGLNVTFVNYQTGSAAINGLLNGEVDVATTTEYPLVGAALSGENISAMTSFSQATVIQLIGRKDSGIGTISDLEGKRIGVSLGTIAQFYLDRFLTLNGLNPKNVTLVNVVRSDQVNAIVNGSVDAIMVSQPQAYTITEILRNNAVSWYAQSNQASYVLEVCRNNWIAHNPELVIRFLKALLQTQNFCTNYPAQLSSKVENVYNFTSDYYKAVWSKDNNIALSLDQPLITLMEDEARWQIRNHLSNATIVPNFLTFIYFNGLEAVKPNAITIIR
jgi:ABC-type nitrate/sulfonate/bicarbonate transport system substrate-binding protein